MKGNTIFCLVGKSGAGKTTIAEELEKIGYVSVCSYTTRKPRYDGEQGHIFISKKDFDSLKDLCAYTMFDGNEYGVPSSMVDNSDIYIIDPDGVKYLRKNYLNKRIVVIGLTAPETELVRRMRERGDTDDTIEKRIKNDQTKFKEFSAVCDYIVVTTNIKDSTERVLEIIKKESLQ